MLRLYLQLSLQKVNQFLQPEVEVENGLLVDPDCFLLIEPDCILLIE